MKKFNIRIVVICSMLLTLITFSSCNEWLTVEPQDALVKEKFWTKTSDVNSALAATYDAMRSTSMKSLLLGEVRADFAVFSEANFESYARIAASNINPTMGEASWADYYKAINLANTLMYYNKEVFEKDKTFTQEMMDGVDAEALFIRSLSYYYLVRLWKDVPLVTSATISDTSELFVPKTAEKVVVKQIISDLNKAKDMAYTTEFKGTNYFYGRANKYSILALLADVYLWDEQYENCVTACNEIINSGLYDLEPYESFFNVYYPGNSEVESIFEFQYDDDLEGQDNPIYGNLIPTSGSDRVTFNSLNMNVLLDKLDPRRFQDMGPTWKYKGKDALGLVQRTANERSANWLIYRYADILLLKAEAEIELGNFDSANELIRAVSERVGMSYNNSNDKEELRQAVLNEKAREFLFEGKRWFDLLRAAKRDNFANKQLIIDMILSGADIKQQAVLKTKVFDTLSYYLPVYKNEIDYNPLLEQNSYYDR
ncbi:MAG: RagB/SusD family nutrient uptake outer membrane protein [Prolixibacteraceae bacterium]|nr:RagB/SusD family nutrient uptake outer membrane protein [Prolixibacteraceae bacterium]